MSAPNDGGWPVEPGACPATSLRDYFAGQALSGMLLTTLPQIETRDPNKVFKMAAESAYLYSDAMLAARSKSP